MGLCCAFTSAAIASSSIGKNLYPVFCSISATLVVYSASPSALAEEFSAQKPMAISSEASWISSMRLRVLPFFVRSRTFQQYSGMATFVPLRSVLQLRTP